MENSFQTSFIPKKPITSSVSAKEPKSLFSIIATFLLVASLIGTAGLYVYKSYLAKQKESSSSSLTLIRDSFEKDTIDELDLFNKRTEASKQILNSHIVLSPMFNLLGEITIPSIQYTKLEQQANGAGFLVKIEGVARDYRAIALQSDMFNGVKGRSFKNVVFSNLAKDKSNNITFNLEFDVDPSILSYENNGTIDQESSSDVSNVTEDPLSQNLENQTQ